MTARFDAFKAALDALCKEHKVEIHANCDGIYLTDAQDGREFDLEIDDETEPTPEERAARDAERAEWWANYKAEQAARAVEMAEWMVAEEKRRAEFLASSNYPTLMAFCEAHGKEQRKKQMRVSTDPTDPAYIDARPRKAWCNDVLIEGWTVADEFRRVVITPEKVHNGSVRVERLPEDGSEPVAEVSFPPIDTCFSGMFVHVPDAPKAAEPVAAPPAPTPIEQLPRVKQETRPAKRRR